MATEQKGKEKNIEEEKNCDDLAGFPDIEQKKQQRNKEENKFA